VLERRLLVVTGKGGVGRSALTAALAIRAARAGRRVLAVSMAAPSGLAAHLGAEDLGYDPREVRPGLHASHVDPAAALDEYLRLRLRVPRLGPLTSAFRLLADTVPGVRDTVVIGKVVFEAVRGDWDLVVADGPATGHVHSYLVAPSTIEGLVPSGRVQEQAGWMRRSLADPEVAGVVLTGLAEEVPVAELVETLDLLAAEPVIDVARIIVNRVLEPLDADLESEPAGPRRDAALHHRTITASQQRLRALLPAHDTLPHLFGTHTPVEVAQRLAAEVPP
jgi:anion-transporting  ArsA/GET3 family ATPase